MMRALPVLFLTLPLGACALFEGEPEVAPPAEVVEAAAPAVRPPAVRPPPDARTAEAFDTTTDAERAAAVAPPVAAAAALGTTVASLGPPAEPGLWLRTGLVTAVAQGRVEDPATGRSVALELRPSGGEAGAGSQISLAALRLLDLPLTALPVLTVYRD